MARQRVEKAAIVNVVGRDVTLRPMTDEDVPAVEAWYGEAAAAVQGMSRREAPQVQNLHYRWEEAQSQGGGGLLVIARRGEARPIGLLNYRLGNPVPGWLTTGFIAVALGHRGWGRGSEAVRLLEAYVKRHQLAQRFRADVEAKNGLGFYFWLRLGYRPAAPEDGFWPSSHQRDIIPMVRLE